MSPVTHLFMSWSIANICNINKRERLFVTLAGVIPDIDGAGIIFDFFQNTPDQPFQLWSKYHHIWGHNVGFGFFLIIFTFALSARRLATGILVFTSFHLHLVCDLAGSRGPDGYQWPIPYLLPFSEIWQLTWEYQWQLNAWPNFIITALTILLTLFFAWKRGLSPLEIISRKANNLLVNTLRNRFGNP